MRRYIVLSAVAASIVAGLSLSSPPLHAAVSTLGASWDATQRWVSSVTPNALRPSALVASLMRAPRLEQQDGGGQAGPTVTTDKSDYLPGDTAKITGSGFPASDQSVTLQVRHVDGTAEGGEGHDPWSVATDGTGGFTSTWFVNPDDSLGSTFVLTAVGNPSGVSAQTTFTDNVSANLDQCANSSAAGGQSPTCVDALPGSTSWQNGNINDNAGDYLEGDSVPYRLRLGGLATGAQVHTVTIGWDTTDSGKHAIDYLTTYNRTILDANPCSAVPNCSTSGFTTFNIPADPNVTNGPNGAPGGGDDITQIPGVMTLFGGTITNISAYSVSSTNFCDPINHPGSYAGSSTTCVVISFRADVSNPVLAWGGHISTRLDWGVGFSAISISGSPYHMRLKDVDGTGGNQDRALSAGAVFFPVQLTVVKETNPDNAPSTQFNYTTIGSFAEAPNGASLTNPSFSLTPPNGTTSVSKVYYFQDLTTRSVTEGDPSPNFSLTNLSCTHESGGLGTSTDSTDLDTRTVSVTPKEGEFITCTFINAQQTGSITIVKATVPAGSTQTFTFTRNFGLSTTFSLNGDGDNVTVGSLTPGTGYSVTEDTLAGWDLTSATCDRGTIGAIQVVANLTTTCTFTNTQRGAVTIVKNTVGGDGTFSYTGTLGLTSLTTSGGTVSQTFSNVTPGTLTVAESDPSAAGFDFTSLVCSDPDNGTTVTGQSASIDVDPGEAVTCTFRNTKRATVKVVKNTVGGDDTFSFATGGALAGQGSPAVPNPIGVATSSGSGSSVTYTFSNLAAAGSTLTLDETALSGWTFTSVSVAGDSGQSTSGDVVTLDVDPGETIVVTYTNTKQATVKVVKNTVGGDDTFSFATSGALAGQGSPAVPNPISILTSGGTGSSATFAFSNLPAAGSTLTLDEAAVTGWDFTSVTVTGDSGQTTSGDVVTLDVDPGETIVVTYTNTKQATVRVVKTAVGGNSTFTYTTGGALVGQGSPVVPASISVVTASGTGTSATYAFSNLAAGGSTLTLDEVLPAGWDFTSVIVTGDADSTKAGDVTTLDVDPGETIVVTYTNTKQATVRVVKNTVGGNGTFSIATGGALGGQGSPAVPNPIDITTALGTGSSTTYRFSNLPAAGSTLTLDEAALTGWDFTNVGVTGDSGQTTSGDVVTLDVDPGEYIVVTYTNTQRGTITIVKQTIGGEGTFNYTGAFTFSLTTTTGTAQQGFSALVPGSYYVTESDPAPDFDFTSLLCNDADGGTSVVGRSATIDLDPGQSITCTYRNTKRGLAKVVKTVNGQAPTSSQTFTFELRQGASTLSDGTVLETKTTDASGNINFVTKLVAAQTYQICEQVYPGWNTNLSGDGTLFVPNSIIPPSLPNPNVVNLSVCADFTVQAGQTRTFNVDNTPPPGGRALTIGFWKNWASCTASSTKKQPWLDQTLAAATVIGDTTHSGHNTLPGIVMSATTGSYARFAATYYLVVHGDPATPNTAPDCVAAVRLLDKSTIDTNKKSASDPAFNLAAQLLAAQLNFAAGAGTNPTVVNTVTQAVLLLGKYQFNGKTHQKISAADVTTMNNYATILDNYNNNRP